MWFTPVIGTGNKRFMVYTRVECQLLKIYTGENAVLMDLWAAVTLPCLLFLPVTSVSQDSRLPQISSNMPLKTPTVTNSDLLLNSSWCSISHLSFRQPDFPVFVYWGLEVGPWTDSRSPEVHSNPEISWTFSLGCCKRLNIHCMTIKIWTDFKTIGITQLLTLMITDEKLGIVH